MFKKFKNTLEQVLLLTNENVKFTFQIFPVSYWFLENSDRNSHQL